jgi:hypothetical protein
MTKPAFDYTIHLKQTWPPFRRPEPPFGPGALEVMRSCPLRSCFEASPGYERRLGFAARIGTAFHRVLQSFSEYPLPTGAEEAAEEARQRFQRELQAQEAQAADRPRERGLPRDQNRIDRAAEAVVIEALRANRSGGPVGSKFAYSASGSAKPAISESGTGVLPSAEVEVPVYSPDGLFHGRVDRAEYRPDGTWLFDYKSALRDDLPGRYVRQLQLYAYMWHSTREEWPVHSEVLYPLAATSHQVSIQPELCQQVAAEAAQVITHLQEEPSAKKLATPGDICRVCDFRPWCQPFWRWQADETSLTLALEKAIIGFEGQISQIALFNYYWRLGISWRDAEIQLNAPQERFPQLAKAQVGTLLRVLDTALRGLRHQPQAYVTSQSELFLVQ